MADKSVEIDRLLDESRLRPIHARIILILACIMLVDGYDLFIAGALIPEIARTWQTHPSALTGVFVAQQFGLLVGVLFSGPLADRFGRKTVLVGCLLGFGFMSFCVTTASTPHELIVLRFISALFFSGVLPNCVAYASEIAPKRIQAGLIGIVFCGYTAGQFVCAAVLVFVVGPFGWHGGFYLGALLPVLLIPIVLFFLPESPRFRATRNPLDPKIAPLLRQFAPDVVLTGTERFVSGDQTVQRPKLSVTTLFRGPLLTVTVLIWLAYLMAFTSNQMLQNWDTTIVHHVANIPYETVGLMLACRTVFGVTGMATAGFIMDRFGATKALTGFFSLSGMLLIALAFSDLASTQGFILYALSGYALNSALSALNAQAAIVYPSSVRVTGIAWASGFGRFGGMLGPIIGGVMLAGDPTTKQLFIAVAVPELLCAATAGVLLWVNYKRKIASQAAAAQVS